MWRVTFESFGGEAAIFWVDGSSAAEAETIARRQAGDLVTADTVSLVVDADKPPAEDDLWPRPRLLDGVRVFTFDDSHQAYDQTQVRDDIHDGDVLHVPAERVAGFLVQAWPVAVSPNTGALHAMVDPDDLVIDGVDYTISYQVARSLVPPTEPPASPPASRVAGGLRYAPDTWTVTIAGTGRHEGEYPFYWVVGAPDANSAAVLAERHHRVSQEDTDTVVRAVEPGAPTADYPFAYEDLRGIPSRTIVLTPHNIRAIARISLAYKRLDRFTDTLDDDPNQPPTENQARVLSTMTVKITRLVLQFINDLEAEL